MSDAKRYQVRPEVSCRDEGADGSILFNPDTQDVVAINTCGRLLWGLLAAPRTADELAAYLTTTYDGVTAEQAALDVAAFIKSLEGRFLAEAGAEDGA